ncbi:hypothetical protein FPOAC2_13403 [Fusarium poae]|jgi:hypothetical protein
MFLDKGSHEINYGQIPGLQQPLTSYHFTKFYKDHNNLPTDDVLLQVEEEVLKNHLPLLKQMFKRYKVENLFAVHIPHRHFEVPVGFSLVGQTISDGRCYSIRRVANNTLNCGQVCGRKFVFDNQGWFPCEFHEGSAPDLRELDGEFFRELTTYLISHDLTSTFGLEYIVPELIILDILETNPSNDELQLAEPKSVPFNDAKTVTTSWGWPDPIYTREIRCIVFPEVGHQKADVKPKEL